MEDDDDMLRMCLSRQQQQRRVHTPELSMTQVNSGVFMPSASIPMPSRAPAPGAPYDWSASGTSPLGQEPPSLSGMARTPSMVANLRRHLSTADGVGECAALHWVALLDVASWS